METKTSAKDFFINLGAIVALYTTIISLLNLLFTIVNNAYPQISNGTNYFSSSSISWPVATLIIFFPIYVLLMWLLEKGYILDPDKRYISIKRWLTYITLFVAGVALAIDLVTILYYFLDGKELTIAFLLKILFVFITTSLVFLYYISEIRGKLNSKLRKIWFTVALVVIIASIVWGFSVLGSPATQRLYKYDEQKINDLVNINSEVQNYYQTKNILPDVLKDLASLNYYYTANDQQTGKPYEYQKTGNTTYNLCAEFNKESRRNINLIDIPLYGDISWTHPAGRHCFTGAINLNLYPKLVPAR